MPRRGFFLGCTKPEVVGPEGFFITLKKFMAKISYKNYFFTLFFSIICISSSTFASFWLCCCCQPNKTRNDSDSFSDLYIRTVPLAAMIYNVPRIDHGDQAQIKATRNSRLKEDQPTRLVQRSSIPQDNLSAALFTACQNGNIEIVKRLVTHPEININVKEKNDKTLLMVAYENNHLEIVKLLLAHPKINIVLGPGIIELDSTL